MLAAINWVNIESRHKVYMEIIAETLNKVIVAVAIKIISSLKYLNTKFSNIDVCDKSCVPESMLNSGTSEDSEISSKVAEKIIKNCNFKKLFCWFMLSCWYNWKSLKPDKLLFITIKYPSQSRCICYDGSCETSLNFSSWFSIGILRLSLLNSSSISFWRWLLIDHFFLLAIRQANQK